MHSCAYVGNKLGVDDADPLREALKASRNTSLVTLRHDTSMHPFRNTIRAHALARAQSDVVVRVHYVTHDTHTTIDYKLA